jgi:hypothetical protein
LGSVLGLCTIAQQGAAQAVDLAFIALQQRIERPATVSSPEQLGDVAVPGYGIVYR